MKPLIILIIFAAGTLNAFSQDDLRFKRITRQGGNAIVGIHAVYKDSEGYIWLGSYSFDLIRMDGRNTRVFKEELLTDYFKGRFAKLIFEDSRKNLWIGTNEGALMQYDLLKDKLILRNDSATSVKYGLSCQAENTDGSFWLGTMGGGLLRWHPLTKKFVRYQSAPDDPTTLPDNYILGLVRDASRRLWVATTGGLCSFDSTTNRFVRHPLSNSNPGDTYRYRVIRHMLLNGNKLYLSTYGGLQVFDLTSLNSEHFFHDEQDKNSLPHNSLFKGAMDPNGSIWLASYGGGLIKFNPVTRKFNSWTNDESDPESISTNNLFSCDIDSDGLLWVGGADNTLCIYNTNEKKFHRLTHRSAGPGGISSGWVLSAFHERDSIFWLGLNGGGLNRLNINTGVAKKFINNPADKFSLGSNAVIAISQDRNKRIWLGLSGAGLNMLDQRTGRFTRYEADGRNSINNNAVSAILVDQDNLLWATTYRNGLNIYDIQQNKFRYINDDSLQNASGISLAFTKRIFEWKGDIWFRTHNQIVQFDKKRKVFVKIAESDVGTSPNSGFIDAVPFTENELMIFTKSDVKTMSFADPEHMQPKVVRLNPNEESFNPFAVDGQPQIWYLDDEGIGKWNPSTGERRHYTPSVGIVGGDLTSIYKDKEGRMFVTGTNGIAWFYPNEIRDDTVSRKMLFTDFKLYNRSIGIDQVDSLTGFSLTAHVSSRRQITLDHDHAFFSLEFSALEFMAPEKIQYAYKLDGFDKNWVQVGNRNFGSYTNLDPGSYTFHVKCANPDGFWSKPVSISIVINPPFWRTWWFITLSIALCGILVYYVHNYRLAQSLKMERLRNKIASDLHDEVGSSLTRVSIYSDLLRNENSEVERANYLSRISALSREVVSTMSDIVWSIDSQSDTMEALLLRMKDFATELLHSRNIQFDFKSTDLPSKALADPALRQNIYLIFKEAINNIVKHADARHVTVEIQNDSSMFRMIIADNGKGFEAGNPSRGNGLRNMEKRGLAINGKVTIESDGSGTRVTFIRKAA